jgi:hypothetical protein
MVFAYQGFTHESGRRCFLFHHVQPNLPVAAYSIQVDLRLFVQHKVPVQEGPSFCLQLLTKASAVGPVQLEKLHVYQVVGDDFRPMVVEREKKEAEKTLRWREQKRQRTAAALLTSQEKSAVAAVGTGVKHAV